MKPLLISIVFLLSAQLSYAQWTVGFRAGMLESKLPILNQQDQYSLRTNQRISSFMIAVPVEFKVNKWFSLALESQLGMEGNVLIILTDLGGEAIQNSVFTGRFPILAKLNVPIKKSVLSLACGPEIGILGKVNTKNNSRAGSSLPITWDEAQLPTFDSGMVLGASFTNQISDKMIIVADLKYRIGLKNLVLQDDYAGFSESMAFSIGALFNLSTDMTTSLSE